MTEKVGVAIVGGGPSGIAAAIALRARGIERVTILEREDVAGGVPRHCGHPPFGLREFGRILDGPAYARRLARAAADAGVDVRLNTSVTALLPSGLLAVTTPAGIAEVRANRVILATGAREMPRSARLLGGDRPIGVISTGTLQHSIYIEKLKPFRRPLIVGTELVSLSAVLTCWKAGIRPVAVVEAGMRSTARWPLSLFPRLLGIPVHYGATISDIRGNRRVESVVVRLADGKASAIACDGLLLTGRFVPEAALAHLSHLKVDIGSGGPAIDQYGRCSDPTYFAAGNLLRPVETAGWSFREGSRVGNLVADDILGLLPAAVHAIRIERGSGLKLAVPQSIALPSRDVGLEHVQLRVTGAGTGTLTARSEGRTLWQRRMSVLPERRILIPLKDLLAAGDVTEAISINFETDGAA
jgi:thioredoxin reductase